MKGTVKLWRRKFGYGFIKGEDGLDYYVHASRLSDDFRGADRLKDLDIGGTVHFDPERSKKGPEARNVRAEA